MIPLAQVLKDVVTWLEQWFTKTDDLAAVALSNDYEDLDNTPNIPSGVVVDLSLNSSSNNAIANSAVVGGLNGKPHYSLSSSDYNPKIDTNVTITVKATNYANSPIASHSVVLTLPNATTTTLTTNSNGIATYTYSCSTWGMKTFSAGDSNIQINVVGWKVIETKQDGTKVWANG